MRLLCPVLGAGRPLLCNLKPAHPAVRPLPSLPLKVNFTLLSKAVKVAAERRAVRRGRRRRRRLWNVSGSRYEVANISPPSLPPPSPSSTSSLFSLRFLFALPFIIRRERFFFPRTSSPGPSGEGGSDPEGEGERGGEKKKKKTGAGGRRGGGGGDD